MMKMKFKVVRFGTMTASRVFLGNFDSIIKPSNWFEKLVKKLDS